MFFCFLNIQNRNVSLGSKMTVSNSLHAAGMQPYTRPLPDGMRIRRIDRVNLLWYHSFLLCNKTITDYQSTPKWIVCL